MLASTGVQRASSSKRSIVIGIPARRATATRCTKELVEPDKERTVVMALSNDLAVIKSDVFWSSHTISTIRFPVRDDCCAWRESTAGIDAKPGNVKPSASAALVMVDAVPIVMQCPGERAIPVSIPFHSFSLILPARKSAQYFQVSVPLPSVTPFQLPRSIGPAGRKIAGRSILSAPISKPGVVLSQPPISTQPSKG